MTSSHCPRPDHMTCGKVRPDSASTSTSPEVSIANLSIQQSTHTQAAKCKWRALQYTCLLLLSVLGGMPASHQGMQARLFVCGRNLITVMYTEKS